MSAENESFIPSLTLDPNGTAAAAAAAEEEAKVEEAKKEDAPIEKLDLSMLSPAEQAAVTEFSEKIDITNTEQVMTYGAAAQKNISEFSDAALSSVRTKDLGETGQMLGDLVIELKGLNFDAEEKKGLRGIFKKATQNIASLKAQYDKAEVNVDKIVEQLEKHEVTLLKDITMMDKMYDKNQEYMKELTMYILAGKLKIEHLRNVELPEKIAKAEETGLPEDAQAANDFANLIGRFEKKIYDLELTRTISVQMAPQIRMVQNNDSLMAEKIRTSIVNTIPLWKNQMVMALSLYHSEQAMKAQREVTDVTNELLKKNAETLHQGSVAIAKESERGIVDLETLKKTNDELIKTLEEVTQIQNDGRARRAAAEEELGRIEGELKQKLLEMKG
ncbi:MAG: toxic anion resistance protein [Oscillospiraceae bacterium]|nr:toxic anion resistance protein [Oscillospiraceae bacterium]MBQ6465898.1 toxic anion resistance protein [Oscillospiraceae bacterium]